MIKIACKLNDVWVVGLFLSKEHINTQDYIDINNMETPNAPPETWELREGLFVVNQERLAQFNRTQMPTLSPIEFDIKLNNAGLYDAVQELIKDKFELRIAYTRAIFFSRTDPFIEQAQLALGLTDEQVDAMWTS